MSSTWLRLAPGSPCAWATAPTAKSSCLSIPKAGRRSAVSASSANLRRRRMNFCSDNVTGAAPEILAALMAANTGALASYGADDLTKQVEAKLKEIFEADLAAFPVATGTAANALSLSL